MDREQAFTNALAAELRGEMAAQGVTLDEMAERIGSSKSSVYRYLKGTRELPMPAYYAMTSTLGVSPADIMGAAVRRMERRNEGEAASRDEWTA